MPAHATTHQSIRVLAFPGNLQGICTNIIRFYLKARYNRKGHPYFKHVQGRFSTLMAQSWRAFHLSKMLFSPLHTGTLNWTLACLSNVPKVAVMFLHFCVRPRVTLPLKLGAICGKGSVKRLKRFAVKRVAAGAHLPTPWLFENAQMIEPTTAWTAVSSPSGSTGYSFLHLSGVGCALWANSGEGSAQ